MYDFMRNAEALKNHAAHRRNGVQMRCGERVSFPVEMRHFSPQVPSPADVTNVLARLAGISVARCLRAVTGLLCLAGAGCPSRAKTAGALGARARTRLVQAASCMPN